MALVWKKKTLHVWRQSICVYRDVYFTWWSHDLLVEHLKAAKKVFAPRFLAQAIKIFGIGYQGFWHRLSRPIVGGSLWQLNCENVKWHKMHLIFIKNLQPLTKINELFKMTNIYESEYGQMVNWSIWSCVILWWVMRFSHRSVVQKHLLVLWFQLDNCYTLSSPAPAL